MVVEDMAPLRNIVTLVLSEAGHEVESFEDGDDALAHIALGRPVDLLVTDLRLPGHDGAEIARALRKRQPDAPVLFMSGHTTEGERFVGSDADKSRFLSKPFSMDVFQQSVAELLTSRQQDARSDA
jgi:DNA-binding response OmpR family regulator